MTPLVESTPMSKQRVYSSNLIILYYYLKNYSVVQCRLDFNKSLINPPHPLTMMLKMLASSTTPMTFFHLWWGRGVSFYNTPYTRVNSFLRNFENRHIILYEYRRRSGPRNILFNDVVCGGELIVSSFLRCVDSAAANAHPTNSYKQ